MTRNILDAVTERSEPVAGNVSTVNSKKHIENNEYPIAEMQQNQEKDEIMQEQKNYKNGWFDFKTEISWTGVIYITVLHVGAVYTLLTFSIFQYKMLTLWALITAGLAGFGTTAGAHRLWSHRSYKAKLPLRIILLVCHLLAGQNSVYNWARNHRVHHKYVDTDADPHNTNRGFFFSHVGWVMMAKHPEVLRRRKQIDMSDILSDPFIQFQEKHFIILKVLVCFIIPTIIPVYCWNEEWYMTIMSQIFIRYVFTLNAIFSINSFAHFWGYRSYDKSIRPTENYFVSIVAMGEGWHNYHHSFPWDYKAAEFGNDGLNLTTVILDVFGKIGWAYDFKEASNDLVRKVVENRGDGSHPMWGKIFITSGSVCNSCSNFSNLGEMNTTRWSYLDIYGRDTASVLLEWRFSCLGPNQYFDEK